MTDQIQSDISRELQSLPGVFVNLSTCDSGNDSVMGATGGKDKPVFMEESSITKRERSKYEEMNPRLHISLQTDGPSLDVTSQKRKHSKQTIKHAQANKFREDIDYKTNGQNKIETRAVHDSSMYERDKMEKNIGTHLNFSFSIPDTELGDCGRIHTHKVKTKAQSVHLINETACSAISNTDLGGTKCEKRMRRRTKKARTKITHAANKMEPIKELSRGEWLILEQQRKNRLFLDREKGDDNELSLEDLRNENKELKRTRFCVDCKASMANRLYLPCACMARCADCHKQSSSKGCPKCGKNIRGIVRVFFG